MFLPYLPAQPLTLIPPAGPADELPDHRGTRVLALAANPLRIDGTLLLALLRRYPIAAPAGKYRCTALLGRQQAWLRCACKCGGS